MINQLQEKYQLSLLLLLGSVAMFGILPFVAIRYAEGNTSRRRQHLSSNHRYNADTRHRRLSRVRLLLQKITPDQRSYRVIY
jgi:hypothetical protein